MKINKVDVFLLRKKLTSSMQISRGGFTTRHHTIVRVHTDEGITGLGEGVGNAHLVRAILNEQMAEMAMGENPFNIESLRRKLMDSQVYFERKGSAICAASAIEMACWDIKGKAMKVPVYQLLGGLCQNRIKAYASDCYWEEDPKDMGRCAARIVESGFKAVKIHIGYGTPLDDLERVKAVRHAIGDDVRLMIDLNCGYHALDAYQAIRAWEPFDLTWIEEPLNPNDIDALANLRSRTKVPIACGENEFQVHGFKELFDKKAIDVAMPDIGRVGGILETKNICVLADCYGVPVSPHNFSSGILLAATLHLMASTSNTLFMEIDTSGNAVIEELLLEPMNVKDGYISVSDSPGLGVELKKDTLEKYAVI